MSSFKLNLLVVALVAAVVSVYIVGSLVVWDDDAEGNPSELSSRVLGGGTAGSRLRVTFSTGALSIVSDCEVHVREQAAGEALPPEVTPTPLVVRVRVVPPTPTPVGTARVTPP